MQHDKKITDEAIREHIKKLNIPKPIFFVTFLGITLGMWREIKFSLEAMTTEPYERDGTIPLIMAEFLWFDIMFESKFVYKYLYRLQNGYYPEGLQ